MVRILLVRPRRMDLMTAFGGITCEPLELETLLPVCRQVGRTELYDGITEERRFTDVLLAFRPDVMALTGYLTQEREMAEYIRLTKRACPACTVIVGGVHAQLNYRRLCWPGVDYVFRTESADWFRGLLEALDRGEMPRGIPGLCRREGGRFVETPYEPCDIDTLPRPDRSGWAERADWFRYLDFARLSTLKTAVSCPFRCEFCYGRNLHGGRYQPRRLELVMEELEEVPGDTVFIVDSDFLLEETRVEAFLDALEERGIRKTFLCYGRADFIAGHPALTARLCRCGFRLFLVGLEGIRDQRLEAWNKGTTREINEACLQVLNACGADCMGLLLADPDFTAADFQALYRWAKEHGLRYTSVQVLTPIPPTPLYERRKGELLSTDLRQWDLAHLLLEPAHMGRRVFMLRYYWLMARLVLLGWRRGAYHFVTPAYLGRAVGRWRRRRAALR